MRKGFVSVLLTLMVVVSVALPVFANAGPPWVTPNLDDLTITAGDPWAYLDPSVTVVSTANDFSNGYVDVAITAPSANDQFQVVNGGLLTISGDAVLYNGSRIGTIDNTYDGTSGHLRVNFSASAPLTNSGFETGDLTGWTVDYTNDQMQGQSWAVAPTGWSSCSAGNHDATPTVDDGTTISDSAAVSTASVHGGTYALQMDISGSVSVGCGTSHSPSILSSAFTAQAGDSLSMWYNAVPTGDQSDVYGFVVNSTGGRQVLFHSTGATGGFVNVNTAINSSVCPSGICTDLQFQFINGTFDATGGMAVGSQLYIDDIVLTLSASATAKTDAMVKAIVENIQYRSTAAYPSTPRPYTMSFKDSTAAVGNNQAQIIVNYVNPNVTGIAPTSGPAAGGTSVVIDGDHLSTATVTFGGNAASCPANTDTQVTCTTPAHAAGVVDVVVTTPGGTITLADAFTYIPAPTVGSIAPNTGGLAGGNTIVITGTNLTGAVVTFDGVAITCTVNSATQITCTIPAHAAGAVDVVITTPGGSTTLTDGFTYYDVPTIANGGFAPSFGPAAGGTSVVITGTNLPNASVTFGGATATCTVNSATQITCTTPAHAAGAVDVVITTPSGTVTATGAFTYFPTPTISSISPKFGRLSGGMPVVITGTNLTDGTVTFGGTAATCTVDSATQISCTTPAHASGKVDVVVTTSGGTATSVGGYGYYYLYYYPWIENIP
jgi:hypothetical protein